MKWLYLVIIFFAVGCSAQQKKITPSNDSMAISSEFEPIVVVPQTATITKVQPPDSSYLIVTILKDGYKLQFIYQSLYVKTKKEFDAFIDKNKSFITEKKIIIKGDSKAPYSSFKDIIEVFKKYNYYRYQLVTNPE